MMMDLQLLKNITWISPGLCKVRRGDGKVQFPLKILSSLVRSSGRNGVSGSIGIVWRPSWTWRWVEHKLVHYFMRWARKPNKFTARTRRRQGWLWVKLNNWEHRNICTLYEFGSANVGNVREICHWQSQLTAGLERAVKVVWQSDQIEGQVSQQTQARAPGTNYRSEVQRQTHAAAPTTYDYGPNLGIGDKLLWGP